LNWEAVNKLWQNEDRAMTSEGHGVGASRSDPAVVPRRSSALAQHEGVPALAQHEAVQERWSSVGRVHLGGWQNPKKITFVMGVQAARVLSLNSANLPSSVVKMEVGIKAGEEIACEEDDTSGGFDDPPSPSPMPMRSWANHIEKSGDSHRGSGVKHDRGVMDSGYRFSAQDFGSPILPPASSSKSPLVSPFAHSCRMDGVIEDLEESTMGGDEKLSSELPSDSDFEDKAAQFDGQEVSSMSPEHADSEPSWRCADLNADLTITDLAPADLVMG
jgi:hypothetical protein